MAKMKVTLSVDEELLKEARPNITRKGFNMSTAFEEALKSFTTRYELLRMAEILGIKIEYISFEDVVRMRKKGGESGKLIRAMRDARANRISGH